MIGNLKLQVFPVWELKFDKMPEDSYRIATERVKWSDAYQKKHGITTVAAGDLPEELASRVGQNLPRASIGRSTSAATRASTCGSTATGRVYVLEANPNPQLAYGEDFAESAAPRRGQLRGAAAADPDDRAVVAPRAPELRLTATAAEGGRRHT